MAFGISPKHEQEIHLDSLTQEEFLVIAIEAVKKLEWNLGFTSSDGLLAYTKFSMKSYGEEVKILINGKDVKLKSECTGSQMFDYGRNKNNIESFISAYEELKVAFTKEELNEKYNALKESFSSTEEDVLNKNPLSKKEKISGFFSLFKPTEGYFITPILVNLNIIIFVLMVIMGVGIFLPENEDLLKWGANFRPITLNGEWWRLLTCCFLHIGIIHLLMNMYALIYIGVLLEPLLGKNRFLAAYLVTGIAASLTSLMWHDTTISAGASGAIFGMYGVFLAMLTTNLIEKSARQSMLTSIGIFVGYNLLNGLKGGIDNAAHIGGLISGLMVGYIYYPGLKNTESPITQKISIGIISACVIASAFVILNFASNDIATFDERIKEFTKLEEEALGIYRLPDSTSTASVLRIIKNPGIKNWEKAIHLFDDLDKLDVPDILKERNKLLRYYCRLRIESYNLLYTSITDTTKNYQSEIESCNSKIEKAITDLGGKLE